MSQEYSDEERLELRNAGVAQLIEIDGKVYMPPGQTTAGTPIASTLRTHELLRTLSGLRELGTELLARLEDAAGTVGGTTGEMEASHRRRVVWVRAR